MFRKARQFGQLMYVYIVHKPIGQLLFVTEMISVFLLSMNILKGRKNQMFAKSTPLNDCGSGHNLLQKREK